MTSNLTSAQITGSNHIQQVMTTNLSHPWFKFYGSEYLNDVKMANLNAQERSCWITLLCLASISSVPGTIRYLTPEVLLEKSGIKHDPHQDGDGWSGCYNVLDKFESMKMIERTEETMIEVVNWNKRQERNATVTERVRKYRMKQSQNNDDETNTEHNVTNETQGNKNVTLDKIREDKIREDKKETVSKKFVRPTLQQVRAYCDERKNKVDPERFIDHYESNGWKVGGKSAMKDWKAAVRTWEKNNFNSSGGKKPENVLKPENKSLETLQARVKRG